MSNRVIALNLSDNIIMCFPQPGPRCSAHANAEFLDALKAFEFCVDPSERIRLGKILDEKTAVFNSTPRGQNRLRQQRDLEVDPVAKALLTKQLVDGEVLRKQQLIAYRNSLLGRDDTVKDALKEEGVKGKYNFATAIGLTMLMNVVEEELTAEVVDKSTVFLRGKDVNVKALILPEKYQGVWGSALLTDDGYTHEDSKMQLFLNTYSDYKNIVGPDSSIPLEWFTAVLKEQGYDVIVSVNVRNEEAVIVSVDEVGKVFNAELAVKRKLSGTSPWGVKADLASHLVGTVFEDGSIVTVPSLNKTVVYDVTPQPKNVCFVDETVYMAWNSKGFFEARKRHAGNRFNLFVKLLAYKSGVIGVSSEARKKFLTK